MNKYRKFWSGIPKASDIKVTKADGSTEHIRVVGKKDAAKIIRESRNKK